MEKHKDEIHFCYLHSITFKRDRGTEYGTPSIRIFTKLLRVSIGFDTRDYEMRLPATNRYALRKVIKSNSDIIEYIPSRISELL